MLVDVMVWSRNLFLFRWGRLVILRIVAALFGFGFSVAKEAQMFNRLATLFLLLSVVFWVGSCSGGGGFGSSAQGKGSVSVFFTDAANDDFSAIYVTVESVELVGGSGAVPVYIGEKTFDILALASVPALFTISPEVTGGEYSKIRLHITQVDLLPLSGSPVTVTGDDLPAGGWVDLSPAGPITIGDGSEVRILLDVDANRSVLVTSTEGGDSYEFRPQIFVEVDDGCLGKNYFMRLSESIANIDPVAGTFTVFKDFTGTRDPVDVTVITNSSTRFFGLDGSTGDFSGLVDGATIHAYGYPVLSDSMSGASVPVGWGNPLELKFMAELVSYGSIYRSYDASGTVVSGPDANGVFSFHQDFGDVTLQLQVQDATLIVARGESRGQDDLITAGSRAHVSYMDTDTDPDALIFTNTDPYPVDLFYRHIKMPGEEIGYNNPLVGTVTGIHRLGGKMTVSPLDGSPAVIVIATPWTATVFERVDRVGYSAYEGVPFGAFVLGDNVSVSGQYDDSDGAFVASQIEADRTFEPWEEE